VASGFVYLISEPASPYPGDVPPDLDAQVHRIGCRPGGAAVAVGFDRNAATSRGAARSADGVVVGAR